MKFKVGELVRFTEDYSKWFRECADEVHSVAGIFRFRSMEDILGWGVDRFSHENGLEVFALIEGDNGEQGQYFAYRVYFFNELGFGTCFIEPEHLERL